jgi:hypothetical protein
MLSTGFRDSLRVVCVKARWAPRNACTVRAESRAQCLIGLFSFIYAPFLILFSIRAVDVEALKTVKIHYRFQRHGFLRIPANSKCVLENGKWNRSPVEMIMVFHCLHCLQCLRHLLEPGLERRARPFFRRRRRCSRRRFLLLFLFIRRALQFRNGLQLVPQRQALLGVDHAPDTVDDP